MALQSCIVCGNTSNRATWNNTNIQGSGNVACDYHSPNLINSVINLPGPPTPAPGKSNRPTTHHEASHP